MKALTICQPYAELIMLEQKLCENRTWSTPYRGLLLIHAGKSQGWLDSYSPLPERMDFGAIIGVATLSDCVDFHPVGPRNRGGMARWMKPEQRWLLDHEHAEGPYCWLLENIRRFPKPYLFAGRQGLFDVPDAVANNLMTSLDQVQP